jgi:carbamoyltransferase
MPMNNRATVAIYGIKDRGQLKQPAYTHDHNLCIMQNGTILQYLSLERLTRKKYDNRLDYFLEDLIESKLIELPDEFDLVSVNGFVGNAFISKNGKIRFEADRIKTLSTKLEEAYGYYQFNEWEGKEITSYNCPQELAHISSCLPFFGNFKENSLLIHFDGAASVSNFSAFQFKSGQLSLIEYGWEMKYLANFFNDNSLAFKILGSRPGDHCSVPGKLMGYACLGNYSPEIENWLIDHSFFKSEWNSDEYILKSIEENFELKVDGFDNRISFFQDVAATFQHIFEREFISKVEALQTKINADYLYYAGGCALNIVANTKLIQKQLFKDVFIPPCCNDSGLSIGAAAFLEWKKGNTIAIHSPYLNNVSIEESTLQIEDSLIKDVSEILLSNGIIGICNDYGEVGPRALGNRSLIALPNNIKISQHLSMEVKKREWYRPVAPIMLKSIAEKVTGKKVHHLSKFMLLDFQIQEQYKDALQGIIHTNQTARIQTLAEEKDNPFMYKLLTYLYQNFGILALINTSFNQAGEPIVHLPEQAMDSLRTMGLDGVVINHKLFKS